MSEAPHPYYEGLSKPEINVLANMGVKGLLFGYPACCIHSFLLDVISTIGAPSRESAVVMIDARRTGRLGSTKPWVKHSFMPCAKCAPEAEANFDQWVGDNILPARLTLDPFYKTPEE